MINFSFLKILGVSNKSVVYPDYNHADASRFLNNYIGDTKSFTNINGIIADYNSPIDLSFSRKGNKSCTFNNWMTDYFVRLNKDTTCKDLLHPPNTQQKNISHVSLHNLYGYHHSRAVCILLITIISLNWIHYRLSCLQLQ